MDEVSLREARIEDADLLLDWRNDAETRRQSHSTDPVPRDRHVDWLSRILSDPARKLFIAEENGTPVGTVRADLSAGVWELSWAVAPSARGRGIGKVIVALLARRIPDPIRAEVKSGNVASIRIAEHAGMALEREVDGVLHYRRPAFGRVSD